MFFFCVFQENQSLFLGSSQFSFLAKTLCQIKRKIFGFSKKISNIYSFLVFPRIFYEFYFFRSHFYQWKISILTPQVTCPFFWTCPLTCYSRTHAPCCSHHFEEKCNDGVFGFSEGNGCYCLEIINYAQISLKWDSKDDLLRWMTSPQMSGDVHTSQGCTNRDVHSGWVWQAATIRWKCW